MTNISIIKSSADLDNKEIFTVSFSSSLNVWSSSDSADKDKGKFNTNDTESSDSDMSESLSSLVIFFHKGVSLSSI